MKVLSKQEKAAIKAELKQLDRAARKVGSDARKELAAKERHIKAWKRYVDHCRKYIDRGETTIQKLTITQARISGRCAKELARIERRRLVLEGRLS
jgi:hypothetical protein